MMRRAVGAVLGTLGLAVHLVCSAALAAPDRAPEPLLVFGAASMTNALGEAARVFETTTAADVTLVFDATSRAARQMAAGAPAEVLVSAHAAWVDWFIACSRGDAATRRIIAGNRLVVAVPRDEAGTGAAPGILEPASHLLRAQRFAIADPDGVPAGIYARQALRSIGLWDAVSARVLRGDSVRTVLAWLETGAVDAGIVYASDAAASGRVTIGATIAPHTHDPIRYEAVATLAAGETARGFIAFLADQAAQSTLAAHGFAPAGEERGAVASQTASPAFGCGVP